MKSFLKKVFSFKVFVAVLLVLIYLQLVKVNNNLSRVQTTIAIGLGNISNAIDKVYREMP